MSKKILIICALMATVYLFSQHEGTIGIPFSFFDGYQDDGSVKIGQTGVKNITLIFAEFEDRPYNINLYEARADTNLVINNWNSITEEWVEEEQWYPVMFSIPKNDGSGELQSIKEYLENNGTLSVYDYMTAAIPDFFDNMTQGKLQINIDYVKNPERVDGLWVLGNTSEFNGDIYSAGRALKDTVNAYYYRETGVVNYLQEYGYTNINTFFPRINWDITATSSGYIQLSANFNETVAVLAHELGHNTLYLLVVYLSFCKFGSDYGKEFT